ncbi:MAG: hypothetical protein ACI8QT_000004 [Halioglobus sp.]|jgi:hypothetical protein
MKKYALIILAGFIFCGGAAAQEVPAATRKFIMEIMVTSKMTGICGLVTQMVTFQETTKMDRGDDFMVRFLTTETARLGMSLEGFVAQCKTVVANYEEYAKDFGIPNL